MVLYLLIGFIVSLLELCFQHYMTPGMIFNNYGKWLNKIVRYSIICKKYNKNKPFTYILAYLAKPLGLCPYCNSTWIGIIVYIYFFGISLQIFLFIGIIWFFVHYLTHKIFNHV
jgi:hypothetical protein